MSWKTGLKKIVHFIRDDIFTYKMHSFFQSSQPGGLHSFVALQPPEIKQALLVLLSNKEKNPKKKNELTYFLYFILD